MPKVLVSAISAKQKNAISGQMTGFTNAHFATGSNVGSVTTSSVVNYNKTLSYATNTETIRTNLSTVARVAQGAGSFSSTNIYIMKGYTGAALSSVVNKIAVSTDSQSAPTITFGTDRRGPYFPCPRYLTRIYFICGFSTAYTKLVTYINTSTDTVTETTDFLENRHVGGAFYTKSSAYLFAGYTDADALTKAYFRMDFSSGTSSVLGDMSANQAGNNCMSYDTYGFLVGGPGLTSINVQILKFRYSTHTLSTQSPTLDEGFSYSVPYSTKIKGYLWTGYRNDTFNRALYIFDWATGTWSADHKPAASGELSGGWVYQCAGA